MVIIFKHRSFNQGYDNLSRRKCYSPVSPISRDHQVDILMISWNKDNIDPNVLEYEDDSDHSDYARS